MLQPNSTNLSNVGPVNRKSRVTDRSRRKSYAFSLLETTARNTLRRMPLNLKFKVKCRWHEEEGYEERVAKD